MTTESVVAAPDKVFTEGLKNEGSDGQESAHLTDAENQYMHGWRLYLATLSLLILFFLVQMESSIASPTLLSITNQSGGTK